MYKITKKQLLEILRETSQYKTNITKITSSADVFSVLIEKITEWKQEHCVCVYLDGANNVIESRVISIGTLNQSLVHPREVFAPAIELRAAAIIIAHNHPSGTMEASREDKAVTKRLIEAGKLLGIEILDHVIFRADKYVSLKEKSEIWDNIDYKQI